MVEVAKRLRRGFDIDLDKALAQVQQFVESCKDKTLIESLDINSSIRDVRHIEKDRSPLIKPSILQAGISILRTRAKLSYSGFAKAYWDTAFISDRYETIDDKNILSINSALQVFLTAEGLLPNSRAHYDCLSRSLALFQFLRATGAPVGHHIGVREHPFEAHAWVTFRTEVLMNNPQQIMQFKTIADLPLQLS